MSEIVGTRMVEDGRTARDSYAQQLRDAFDWLGQEARDDGARLLPIHLTPYISALPYRIDAIEALISDLATPAEAWVAPCNAIVEAWASQK